MQKVEFDEVEIAAPAADDQLIAVKEALTELVAAHPVQAEVVKLRYFVGLTNEEVAQLLGLFPERGCSAKSGVTDVRFELSASY